jgi:hypothetical protein
MFNKTDHFSNLLRINKLNKKFISYKYLNFVRDRKQNFLCILIPFFYALTMDKFKFQILNYGKYNFI